MVQLSVWEKETFFAPQDVIIIGSGFAGLWSALKIAEKSPGKKITILERGIIPTGASTRNAGFSCFGSPSELLNDIALMGEEKAFRLVQMRYNGLIEIGKYFPEETIDYRPDGGYECFKHDSADWESSSTKLQWLNEKLEPLTGEKNTYNFADEKLEEFGFAGFDHLIECKSEGGLHSAKLIKVLLHKVQNMGVQVITGVAVANFENTGSGIAVRTNHGINFFGRQLLICTNAFTKELLPDADIIPNRGQVIVTNEIEGLKLKGNFHFERGFYYFRNLGNRLLIGGARNKALEEENTTELSTTDIIQNELENFVSRHLLPGKKFTVTDRWSGIMAMGTEKLPIVKEVDENVFCCIRMSGMGVALAPVVAGQVAEMMGSGMLC